MKRVAVTFVEVSCVFGFCCWLTPITPTVLCVSTCSDGLLDFHKGAKQSTGKERSKAEHRKGKEQSRARKEAKQSTGKERSKAEHRKEKE